MAGINEHEAILKQSSDSEISNIPYCFITIKTDPAQF